MYSTKIYKSWKKKQDEKYEDLMPRIKKHLTSVCTVIDIGIGPAWIYDAFEENDVRFAAVDGVDPDPEIIEPRHPDVEYHVTEWFATNRRFDFLICFDTLHLIKEPSKLLGYVRSGGLALISVPQRHASLLKQFMSNKILESGEI
ncbi:methyltransferase domain-containing protein, partial [Candidatus Micrarchaeota archaeon]|nr:methyltransferase domain-containing protein [Candidatus Micrarchaeota archaeon]